MSELFYPDAESPVEVRDFEQREITARLIPYGQTIMVRGRPESFAMGAASGIDPTSIKLLSYHDQKRPIGKSIALEEREDGAYATFRVSRTAEGNEMLELANDGVLDISPGFIPGTQNQQGVHQRLKALPEASLVTFAAYPGAKVLSVREKEADMADEKPTGTTEIEEPVAQTVDLGPIETRMASFEQKLDKVQSLVDAPAVHPADIPSSLTPFNWFRAQVEANFRGRLERREKLEEDWSELQTRAANGEIETRALADVTGGETQAGDNSPTPTDLSGLVVEEFMADQLVNILDKRRPVFRNLGSIRMPRSGYAVIPTVTQHTLVGARGSQKTAVPSQKMITTNAEFKANWLAGAVDIALEVIRSADLDVLNLVWSDLLGQYAKATELDASHGVIPFIQGDAAGSLEGYTYTEAALDTASYAAFIADVLEWSEAVEDATGEPATKLFVTRAQFRTIAGFVDANDRRLFSMIGATNADARAGLNANEISLPGGPTIVKASSDDLTSAILTNESSLKVADGGPERVEALNVELMGRDLGILGRVMIVPRIPAGVVRFTTTPI